MLNTPVRTTIEMNPNLLYRAKLKALSENKSLKEIVWESLMRYLDVKNIDELSPAPSRFIEPRISKKKFLANIKKIKGIWWTKEDDIARKKMEEKEKWW